MADDLETLRMLRSMFTGSVPTKRTDKNMTDEFMRGEAPTSPAYGDIKPTEKPLEYVEFPWEMLMPTMRALNSVKFMKIAKRLKDRSMPAGKGLTKAIRKDVGAATGYSEPAVKSLLKDLNKNNPLSQRAYEKIKEIDLVGAIKAPYSSAEDVLTKAKKTVDLLEELDFKGKTEVSKVHWKKLAELMDN